MVATVNSKNRTGTVLNKGCEVIAVIIKGDKSMNFGKNPRLKHK